MPYDENGDWYDDEDMEEAPPPPPAFAEPWEGIAENIPERQYSDSVIQEMSPPQTPQQPVTPYAGEAFPGLPVIQEGGQNYYNGERMVSEEAAMQARARHAAASPEVQQQMAARGQQQQQTSIDIQQRIAELTPSPADRRAMTQLQNGRERLRRDLEGGRISQQHFDQMDRMIAEKLRPKMMTQRELLGAQRALEVTLLEERTALLARQRTNAEDFDNASQRQPNIWTDPESGQRFLRTREGWVQTRAESTTNGARGGTGAARSGSGGGQASVSDAQKIVQARIDATTDAAERTRLQRPEVQEQMVVAEMDRVNRIQQNAASLRPGGPVPFDPPAAGAPWGVGVQGLINNAVETAEGRPARRVNGQLQPAVPASPERNTELRAMSSQLRAAGHSTGRMLELASPADRRRYERLLTDIGYYRDEFTPAVDHELAYHERLDRPGGAEVTPAAAQAARGIRNILGEFRTEAGALAVANNPQLPQEVRDRAAALPHHLATIRVFRWGRTAEENRRHRAAEADGPARPNRRRPESAPAVGDPLTGGIW